ncbi:MAG: hypothetical protein RBQ97_00555, partial [Acholeplasma sp.]|nr:hypothetical protein [Acholeplasma sp.]
MKKNIKVVSLLLMVVMFLSTTLTFSYLFSSEIVDDERIIGTVGVASDIYFVQEDGSKLRDLEEVEMKNPVTKGKVYRVNVSSTNDQHHIDRLRIDFLVNSNVETYFRVRFIDSLTLTYTNSKKETIEQSVPNDGISYVFGSDWYYDANSDWYYFKSKVTKTTHSVINFIMEGLEYPLKPVQYQIQLGLNV